MMLRILTLLLVALAACKSRKNDDNPLAGLSTDRRVLNQAPSSPGEAQALAPPEWFDEQLRIIEAEIAAGELEAALNRSFAVRKRRPGQLHRVQLEQLIRRANAAVLGLDTLEAVFLTDGEPLSFGQPLRVRVRMTNLGRKPIRILKELEGATPSLFEIELVRREWDTRAQTVTNKRIVRIPLEEEWEIPASGSVEQVMDLGMFGNDKGLNGFRVYAVRGKLRPSRLEIGTLRRWDSIGIAPVYVRSFRPNWEHLADEPLRRVQQAVEKQAATHLMTASALLAPEEKQAAVDLLIEELRGDRVIDWAILSSLEYLTRIELGRDMNAWKAWWPRVRETYFDALVERERLPGPAFEVGR
ncbi:MAG: hypothetical protein AAGD14_09070 [Planctomycetota bacterium]